MDHQLEQQLDAVRDETVVVPRSEAFEEDIARTLGLTASAVKSRLMRARTALGPLLIG